MRIYTQNIPQDIGKFKILGEFEHTTEKMEKNTTDSTGKKETEKKVIKKTIIKSGKEDYGALFIGILIVYGLYSKAFTVEQAIAMIGAIFLGWGGYSYKKSKEAGKTVT